MTRRPFMQSLQHWLTGLMLSALLATQWVAVVHSASGHGRHHAAVRASPLVGAHAAEGVRAMALAHDEGSGLCQVLDHCLHAGHVAAEPLQLDETAPARIACPGVDSARLSARWGDYLARAPPALVPMHLA